MKMEFDQLITETELKIAYGNKVILNPDVSKKVHFILFDYDQSKFVINPEFCNIVDKLIQGQLISIAEKRVDSSYNVREVGLRDSFGVIKSKTVATTLLKLFFEKLSFQVDLLNEYSEIFFKNTNVNFKELGDELKEEKMKELGLWLYTEVTKRKIFGDDFAVKAGLFYKDADKIIDSIEDFITIFSEGFSTILKGELALIMVWLHSLLLMKNDPEYNDLKYLEIIKDFEIRKRYLVKTAIRGVQILTDIYNPFIRYIFDIDMDGYVHVKGLRFIEPYQLDFKDSIFFEELSFDYEDSESIFTAILKLWQKDKRRIPFEFRKIDFVRLSLENLLELIEMIYNLKLPPETALLMVYYHSILHTDRKVSSFLKNKVHNIDDKKILTTDYWLIKILETKICRINSGFDLFSEVNYVLVKSIKQDECFKLKALSFSDSGKYTRRGKTEIESKSGWSNTPASVKFNVDNSCFYSKPSETKSGLYLPKEELSSLVEHFEKREFNLVVYEQEKNFVLDSSWLKNHSKKELFTILLNAKKFRISRVMQDRVYYNTIASLVKNFQRKLVDTVELYPELNTKNMWKKKLFSSNDTDRFKNMQDFLSHIYNGKNNDWNGLRVNTAITVNDCYGNTKTIPITKELVFEYFSFMVYYNLLLFFSGLPVFDFEESLVQKNVYLPKVVKSEKNIKDEIFFQEIPNATIAVKNPFFGPLRGIIKTSYNLRLKICIESGSKKIRETVLLSDRTFTPLTLIQTDNNKKQFSRIMALQIVEKNVRKIIYLDNNGNKQTKVVEDDSVVNLRTGDRIYGAVIVGENLDDPFVDYEARLNLFHLLLYGGEQYDGQKIEAIADIFNKHSLNPYTNKEKAIPFLSFLLIGTINSKTLSQLFSLADPVFFKYVTRKAECYFTYRSKILSVSCYLLDSILGCNLGWLFDEVSKFSEAYNNIIYEGKYTKYQGINTKQRILHILIQDRLRTILSDINVEKGKERRVEINNYYVKLLRKKHHYHIVDLSREKKRGYVRAKIFIPISYYFFKDSIVITKEKIYSIRTMFTDVKDLDSESRIKSRDTFCKNLIFSIETVKNFLPTKIQESVRWKEINNILSKYYAVSESGEIFYAFKQSQISSRDIVHIVLVLFPELLAVQKIRGQGKDIVTKDFDINLLKENYDAKEFLKILPKQNFVLREPYLQFLNFFSFFVCSKHIVKYFTSNNVELNAYWSFPETTSSTIVKNFVLETLKLWIPWLILRSENIEKWLSNYSLLYKDMYTTNGILNLIKDKRLPSALKKIVNLTIEDINSGMNLLETRQINSISFEEKLVWTFITLSRYVDSITYSLGRHIKAIDDLRGLYDINEETTFTMQMMGEFLRLIKKT